MKTLARERIIGVVTLLVLLLAGCAHATTPPISLTESRITTDPGDQYDPAIWEDIVVFTDYRSADTDVYYHDLSSGQEIPVIVAPGNQELTDVSGGIIVYTDYRSSDVMVYDVSSGQTTDITAPDKIAVGHPFNSIDPATDGTIVAWEDSRDGNMEIYAMDRGPLEERRITDNSAVDSKPAVSDGHIVWQRCEAGGTCDIWLYTWADGTTQQITATPDNNERNSDMNGQNIVYQGDWDRNSDISVYHLDTGTEERLTLAGDQANPHVWGDNVAFDDLSSGIYHITLWNIPSDSVFDLTTGTSGQYLNSIWENRVVYTDDRNGDLEIYMTEFTFQPPVASFTADPTSGQGPLPVQFTDTSSGDPDLWAWVFGDGGTSSDPNPSHNYPDPGSYMVSLTVTNQGGSNTATQTITVLPAPTTTLPVSVDIEPGLCPNLIGLNMKGPILVVAIPGTKDMDVTRIDPAAITLSRDGVMAEVRPVNHVILDVARPYTGTMACGCQNKLWDGTKDLVLVFDIGKVVNTLQLKDVVGQTIPFTVKGALKAQYGATPIAGSDCVKVISLSNTKIGQG